jgi:hypothetical protein
MKCVERQYQDEIDELHEQLKLAERKLAEFGQGWDGEKYVLNGDVAPSNQEEQ